jgi:hypothetical protein
MRTWQLGLLVPFVTGCPDRPIDNIPPTQNGVVVKKIPMQDATTPAATGPRPCWWIDYDPVACPAPDTGFELKLVRTQFPAPGTSVELECALLPAS